MTGVQRGERTLPGGLGIWLLVLSDLLLFGLYFVAYMADAHANPAIFAAGHASLHPLLGLANAILLLTGSWMVALGVEAAGGDQRRCASLLGLGAASGVVFLSVKAFEYAALVSAGQDILTSRFFTWYFMLTGFHAVHVVFGVATLAAVAVQNVRGAGSVGDEVVRSVAIYWHLVDLLWIGIFACLYAV